LNFLSPTLIDTNKNTNISKSTTDDKKILASRLATNRQSEAGLSIEEIALVTGHKDWRTLQRYTKSKPEELHKLQTAPHPSLEFIQTFTNTEFAQAVRF
jgi:site-specific recombinase XerD